MVFRMSVIAPASANELGSCKNERDSYREDTRRAKTHCGKNEPTCAVCAVHSSILPLSFSDIRDANTLRDPSILDLHGNCLGPARISLRPATPVIHRGFPDSRGRG
jgi:hypothetical protein